MYQPAHPHTCTTGRPSGPSLRPSGSGFTPFLRFRNSWFWLGRRPELVAGRGREADHPLHTAHMCGSVQVVVRHCEKKALDVWEASQRLGVQHERLGREDLQVGHDERRQEVSRRPSSRDEHTNRSQHVRSPTCCPVNHEPAISRCFGRETGIQTSACCRSS
jgi:hypothetical protein